MLEGDNSAVAVGKRLKRLRQMAGLTREDLAKNAAVGKSSISYWERAKAETPLTPRSMVKILNAVKAKGIDCDERWILTGIGISPRPITLPPTVISDPLNSDAYSNRIQKLISTLDEELKLFTSVSESAVILKIEDTRMSPILEMGDIVGGLWQLSSTLYNEKICIINIDGKLQARKIKPTTQENLFYVTSFQEEQNVSKSSEKEPVSLKWVAPIIRVWR